MKVAVVGAGVAGLSCAVELLQRGAEVCLYERGSAIGQQACSWYAGGMLAPWCERENADEAVLTHGKKALAWWQNHTQGVVQAGSLVVANPRDQADIKRFSARTSGHHLVNEKDIQSLEPDLAGRFIRGLYFPDEAHIDPRKALQQLAALLVDKGAALHFNCEVDPQSLTADVVLDCRGYAARDRWSALRGVKGEMLIVKTDEVTLNRPVRLLHPRIPLYIVPRDNGEFMVGATMVENAERERLSVRSMLELLGAAYALHPAFAEAEILETGVDVRPAFEDNLPRIRRQGRVLQVNGLYRHGYLLSPVLAQYAADMALNPEKIFEGFT